MICSGGKYISVKKKKKQKEKIAWSEAGRSLTHALREVLTG
jgi:hypothetical protein